jgi:hypothetical protein
MMEKRMKKLDGVLREIRPPVLEGPADAALTLIGWGSTQGVIRESRALLAAQGIKASQLQIKYLHPFHVEEVTALLKKSKKLICVEGNYSGQFARLLRAETGISVDANILKYDGEPFEPRIIAEEVKRIMAGKPLNLDVTSEEAREMAYHYIRAHLGDAARPLNVELRDGNSHGEPVWRVEIVKRASGEKSGELEIGVKTGAVYTWQPVSRAE